MKIIEAVLEVQLETTTPLIVGGDWNMERAEVSDMFCEIQGGLNVVEGQGDVPSCVPTAAAHRTLDFFVADER